MLYYGDEIGMGDNIYLGDRNGVRTPMQWSGDRNAGFSRPIPPAALPARRSSTPITATRRSTSRPSTQTRSSLLQWMQAADRAAQAAQGVRPRHASSCCMPDNRKVLAYIRQDRAGDDPGGGQSLPSTRSRSSSDLSQFQGFTPLELFGQTPFPAIGSGPYFLSLGRYNFYWFQLQPGASLAVGEGRGKLGPVLPPGEGRGEGESR